jgi:seryl-tRNA synthetase
VSSPRGLASPPKDRPIEIAPGLYGLGGEALALLHGIDARIVAWAREVGAAPRRYPTLISTASLLRTDYYATFPSQATFVALAAPAVHPDLKRAVAERGLERALELPPLQLRPALCYHVYEELAGSVLQAELAAYTVGGTCFRREATTAPLRRQWEFTMREVVFVGAPERLAEQRAAFRARSEELARELGLAAAVEVANDPFFGTTSRGRALYQKARQLKWELVQNLSDGTPLAIASFNLHEDYFTRGFEIHRDPGRSRFAATACNAWGLERWIAAIVDRHGREPAGWPRAVRELARAGAGAPLS